MNTILVIDDDPAFCRTVQIQLAAHGHETQIASTVEEGIEVAQSWKPALILLDVHLPGADGVAELPKILGASTSSTVVVVTGDPDNVIAGEAMKGGAFDYLRKPLDLTALIRLTEKIFSRKREENEIFIRRGHLGDASTVSDIVGSHPKIIELHKKIGLLARSRLTVLIEGESGTGKELAAWTLHEMTASGKPFVAINCSAIVATLLESELFGHEKGAFTGAESLKRGKLEYAGEGTVFLDEVSDLPAALQAKLLRVLQEEEFVRVGGLESLPLRARIIAATHQNLSDRVRRGEFREDLYYRLAVSRLQVPPLRERREDFPLLVRSLLSRIGRRLNRKVSAIDHPAMDLLLDHTWPGNVRELENVMTRAIAYSTSTVLGEEDFAPSMAEVQQSTRKPFGECSLAEAEKLCLDESLSRCGWNITHTAKVLDISPTTLRKKIADYGLSPARRRSDGQ